MWTSGVAAWLLACNPTPRRFHQPAKAAWQSWAADEPQGGRTLERRMRPLFLSAMLFLAASSLARADDLACVSTTFRFTSPSDKVCVSNFDDPKVPGVTCFISQARKGGWGQPLGLNEDPSNFSVARRQLGPITTDLSTLPEKEEAFSEKTSIFFKATRDYRVPDVKRNALIYLAISSKVIEGSPTNAISVVPIMPWASK
jgi:CreA protein